MYEMSSPALDTASQRREVRVDHCIPLTLTWVDSIGESHLEDTETEVLNSYGCRLTLALPAEEGMTVVCENPATGQTRKAKFIWIGETEKDKRKTAGLELIDPGANFWGVEAQVALQEAGLFEKESREESQTSPEEVQLESTSTSRRGLLYALLSSVTFYFLGGYSALSLQLELNEFVKLVLLPLLFFGGLGLALYASIFLLRRN